MWLFGQVGFSWDHGIAIGVLSALFAMLGWAGKRILGDGGILDRFIDGLFERLDKQLSMCNMHGKGIVLLNEKFEDREDYKTTETNKSLADMARVELLKLHSRAGLDDNEREQIVKILSAVVERLDPTNEKE